LAAVTISAEQEFEHPALGPFQEGVHEQPGGLVGRAPPQAARIAEQRAERPHHRRQVDEEDPQDRHPAQDVDHRDALAPAYRRECYGFGHCLLPILLLDGG
jgi:hypothetical protein